MTPTKQHHLHVLLLLLICSSSIVVAAKHNTAVLCHPDQASSLLQLKQSFIDVDAKLASWRAGSDCCHWEGVTCDRDSGRVISLDLGGFNLMSRHLHPAIFNLTSLRNLSLAHNDFGTATLPTHGFEQLPNIIHLNFSSTSFFGQFPVGIARLKNLATLDFSDNFDLYLQEPNFQTFMANLSYLRELRLDAVDISTSGSNWSIVLADSVPQLQILSLFLCGMSGPIHHSFSRLRSLTIINLRNNERLTGKVPEFFVEFSSLRILDISGCSFRGQFPTKIILMKSLRVIDLSESPKLSVCLPDFPVGNNLEVLNLAGTTLSCDIRSSLTNLKSLKNLGLSTSEVSMELSLIVHNLSSLNELQLYGGEMENTILSWIGNLTQLTYLMLYMAMISLNQCPLGLAI
ncbi:receptor-like protein 7 [Triticum aestivum]|uniref:Leucine-rich repeat-containing N-terminal plant-type domain-containing protein n=1 Tax=Triticum turgidum subsp. durum TaxID=4567 RepID=A0A9R1RXY7_TRITD|nr:receptor-like protein 7 [Triticum aestivum]VAH73233.1 unnamed protein product [Triticum turgidum subsp. durum]